jgi:hypothetical protein
MDRCATQERACSGSVPGVIGDRRVSPFGRPSDKRLDREKAARICVEDGCDTLLNRYNNTNRCGIHEAKPTVRARRNYR